MNKVIGKIKDKDNITKSKDYIKQQEKIINADKVIVGDVIRVLPGETVPVDSVILSGETSINQAVMTGESMPVDKTVGDKVSSGTVNLYGAFDMVAEKVGEDSSFQRLVRLVESADAGKAKIVGIADRWATWIVIIALTAAAGTWFVTGQIIRAVTILVVFCPCALVLATPTAIVAAIGNSAKHGFLVRRGDVLEKLAKVSKITFDKTGTLTYGKPEVIEYKSVNNNITDEELYCYVATAESFSEHPLGTAITRCFKASNIGDLKTAKDFTMLLGQGISAKVNESHILAGNIKLLNQNNIKVSNEALKQSDTFIENSCTVVYIAVDGVYSGYIVLSDTLRKESIDMISELNKLKAEPVLVTGDHKNAAQNIAKQLGISTVYSDCLPEDKLNVIDTYQKEQKIVCMIGDGINDAPALKKADIGIAMGGIGSDIAVEAADIALINDEVKELPHLVALSKRMMITIKCNMTFSMTLNFIAIILAMTGLLNPVIGALVHNCGSVLVIINSFLILKWKYKR